MAQAENLKLVVNGSLLEPEKGFRAYSLKLKMSKEFSKFHLILNEKLKFSWIGRKYHMLSFISLLDE